MSLESAIRENTAALEALTAALSTPGLRPQPVDNAPGQDNPPPEALAAYRDHEATKKDPSPTKNEQAKLDYDKDVKPYVLRLAAQSRDALRAILDGIGVEKGSQVKPEALPEFLAQVKAAL